MKRDARAQLFPDLDLPIHPPYAPMESKPVPKLPRGEGFQFEPKWDGFRCIAFRDGNDVVLQSKAGEPLGAYFPEIVAALRALKAPKFVLDGEIVIPSGDTFSFDGLLARMRPHEDDVDVLAAAMPASLILFDLLLDARGRSLTHRTLAERRLALEDFARMYIVPGKLLRLTPATTQRWVVDEWTAGMRDHGIDGIMIKRIDQPYRSGERSAMQKMKWIRTVDCVVGGLRYASEITREIASLCLGLFDREGLLHCVGTCSLKPSDRPLIADALANQGPPTGFTGRAPGESAHGNHGKAIAWVPLDGALVVEVQYDHAASSTNEHTAHRFRHATKLLRFRPDKAPRQCTTEQIEPPASGTRLKTARRALPTK